MTAGDDREAFLDRARVAEFWNQARRAAAEDQQTGYLQDEWPDALGANRLRGEWACVRRWLDDHRVPRGSCLDVGCGVGVWLERLAGEFERADGIDLASEMVASATARMARLGIHNAHVTCCSVLELPDDRRYDLIFVGGVLMYLNDGDVEPILARLARLLSPGGLLVLRESTSTPAPWYRDTPLQPGLFATRGAPRPPYFAIYRTPGSYVDAAARAGLAIVHHRANRDYKLADLTESWLRRWNWLLRGRLARRRASAERAARWIDRLRWLLLLPEYYLVRTLAPRAWRLNNHWYLARAAPAELSSGPAARSS